MNHRIRIHKTEPNTGAWDFSHLLDAPAGKHGFVRAKKGHFYFEDGERARFIGFSVAARSNTPDHETADKLAERFARMGVNVIRLHAADAPVGETPCTWSSCKEAPLLDYSGGTSRKFNPEGLDRFDYLFAKLKEKGIYLHIDLMVAREYLPGDELDYPGGFPECAKCYPTMNERLIELQMEYAKNLLTHINPYTGLSIIDDPAVMTIQLSNEESAIKGTNDTNGLPELEPYREERRWRFNHFLLAKYHTRSRLKEAWTYQGVCALRDDEDPEKGTVDVVQGDFYQPVNDPMGQWDGDVSPARYADYMEFGIAMNRRYYQRMRDYIRSLGAKVPIACSNLPYGGADIYGHTDGDVMEQDSYFNHPVLGTEKTMVSGPTEYVGVNPLTMQKGIGSMATTLLSFGATACVAGKPFALAEWNEYGLHPFHSTSFVQTVAYACLNDWDALILYNHHTSENWDDQPADEIHSVFDAYNDPALICQWGFMAEMFLKGLVSTAKRRADVVYTQGDLRTLPKFHTMPGCILPYITGMRSVFLDSGDSYSGDADLAVNAGFLNGADLSDAKHGVYYAWSPYRDAWRRAKDSHRLADAARDEKNLVIEDIAAIAGKGDYRDFAGRLDAAMKKWGILEEGTGLVDGALVSDTGELCFDPDHLRFTIRAPRCGYFSGAPGEEETLSDKIRFHARNERISVSLLAVSETEYLLTAMGKTGMDETTYAPGPEFAPGIRLTIVDMKGKLFAETMEGSITVQKTASARLTALDTTGHEIGEIEGVADGDGIRFALDGSIPAVQFKLTL